LIWPTNVNALVVIVMDMFVMLLLSLFVIIVGQLVSIKKQLNLQIFG